jgi:hypothetical protein
VRRVKAKIDKEFVTAKTDERERADRDYATAKDDLEKILLAQPSLKPKQGVPVASDDKGIELTIDEITKHFESAKATAFESAREILGKGIDPANSALISDLEKNIGRALERVSHPQSLTSAARLSALRQLTPEQLNAADTKIHNVLVEANALDARHKTHPWPQGPVSMRVSLLGSRIIPIRSERRTYASSAAAVSTMRSIP